MEQPIHSPIDPRKRYKYILDPERAFILRQNPPCNMSVLEGASYIGISPRKLRQLIQEGRVKFARIGSKIILRREYLDELVKVVT